MRDLVGLIIYGLIVWYTAEFARSVGRRRWVWALSALLIPLLSLGVLVFLRRFPTLVSDVREIQFWRPGYKRLSPEVREVLRRARDLERTYLSTHRSLNRRHLKLGTQLEQANDKLGRQLSRAWGVTVYEFCIKTPRWSGPIDGVEATVVDDSQVVQRLTLTRFAAVGPLSVFAPKRKMLGDVRILINGPQFSYTATALSRDKGSAQREAYRLADTINNAARNAASLRDQRKLQAKSLEGQKADLSKFGSAEIALRELHDFVDSQPSDVQSVLRQRVRLVAQGRPSGNWAPPTG